MLELLAMLGVDPSMILAGLIGGVCKSLAVRENSFSATAGSAIIGAAVSNYLGGWIAIHSGFDKLASGFISGVGGIVVIDGIVNNLPKLLPAWLKGESNAKP